ncbi:UdgX family uracil-DNA binding protein [Nocardia brasiliensis]|uniref:Type-4 uracil-DNA glycosylase n=1 Tax=Nocardia brasiliensis TaxID=37326 RepID=A0A6G9Y2Q4_NOCBR|nr:UdgX family uracil-DNA binding protein [Nocardia brasiliensis]QIS07471.1 UdgX family uracil-DNA binding protein [Nocardia brasiliensis]
MPRSDSVPGAAEYVPSGRLSLTTLRTAARHCHGCDLYRDATQTVFGEGPATAAIVMVGEQPGDQEDVRGHPFVGPAGGLLDRALAETGIPREQVYLTNAVKHFKFTERGKRRIHKQPGRTEIVACSAWLNAELSVVRPKLVVGLGAIAAKALLGNAFKVRERRGEVIARGDYTVITTVHPAAVLRARDRTAAYLAFVEDLGIVAREAGLRPG